MLRILTFHQYELLALLSQRSQWTLKEIAQILQVTKSAVCKCIQRLERLGVIEKEVQAGDPQCMSIYITQEGEEAMRFIAMQKFV
jgi:DNA-binding MarR family transcriptional regulator